MAGISTRPSPDSPDAAAFQVHLERGRLWLAILIPIVLLASVVLVRGGALGGRSLGSPFDAGAAAANLSPAELTAAAADKLEAATAKGGTGYTFEIVQTSTIVARPGGPLVDLPDPADRHKSLGLAESYALSIYLERGGVTPDGFWSEIRRGPDAPDAKPDVTTGDPELAALVRDGRTYRNDGDGWYETPDPPGIGLDPATAALLPTMLRNAAEPKDAPPEAATPSTDDDAVARSLEATTAVADVPGIVAVDLAAFTVLTKPAVFGFDADGRLASLTISARNTGLETFDLLVLTTITFSYPAAAPDLPRPEPAYVAPAATQDEG